MFCNFNKITMLKLNIQTFRKFRVLYHYGFYLNKVITLQYLKTTASNDCLCSCSVNGSPDYSISSKLKVCTFPVIKTYSDHRWRTIGWVFLRTCAWSLEASKRTFSRISMCWGLAAAERQSILGYWRTLRRSQIGALWLCYGLRPGKGWREGLWWRAFFQVVNGILTKRWEAGLTFRRTLCMVYSSPDLKGTD